MIALIIILHAIVCALLIIIILIQRGRGGGLLESFSGVESMFGTKTSAFLSRVTATLATLFMLTCIALAFLSASQSRSLMRNVKTAASPVQTTPDNEPVKPAAQEMPKLEEKNQQETQAPQE